MPKIISLHDVLEPLKQALLASRDVIISSQICGSNMQKVFTLGDGCWLPRESYRKNAKLVILGLFLFRILSFVFSGGNPDFVCVCVCFLFFAGF